MLILIKLGQYSASLSYSRMLQFSEGVISNILVVGKVGNKMSVPSEIIDVTLIFFIAIFVYDNAKEWALSSNLEIS